MNAQTNSAEFFEGDMIVARLKAGDENALDYIKTHLLRRMMRSAYQHTQSAELVEDAIAITLVKIWKKRDLLPNQWQDATKYILTMTGMTTIDLTRSKEERVAKTTLDEARTVEASTEDEPEENGLLVQALETIEHEYLPKLSPRHFKILAPVSECISKSDASMTEVYAQIAETQHMSAGAVRNTWSDAGKKLQEVLQALGWFDYNEDDVRSILAHVAIRASSRQAVA